MPRPQRLSPDERELLSTIVVLHEQHGQVLIHENMREDERETVSALLLKGFVELRPIFKDQPVQSRPVVPTGKARALVASFAIDEAA